MYFELLDIVLELIVDSNNNNNNIADYYIRNITN